MDNMNSMVDWQKKKIISHQMTYKSFADIINIMKSVYNFKASDGEARWKKKGDTNERKIRTHLTTMQGGVHAIFQLEKLFEFINRMVYNEDRFIVCCKVEKIMNTSDMIKELCNKKNISISELVRRTG